MLVVTTSDLTDGDHRRRLKGEVKRILQTDAARDHLLRGVRHLLAACVERRRTDSDTERTV